MSATTVLMVQLEVEACTAELYLNDVPVSRIDRRPGRIPIENIPVEQLIVPGENRIELLLEPGSTPSIARTEFREVDARRLRARGRLARFADGEPTLPDAGDTLAEVYLEWKDDSSERRQAPASGAASVDLGAAHGRWRFLDAPRLELGEACSAEAGALMDELEACIVQGHYERIFELCSPQLEDAATAYAAVSMEFLREDLRGALEYYRGGSNPVVPRDPSKHDFRLVAGGRLLHLVDRDWSPSFKVRGPTSGNEIGFPMFLGRVDGKLRIVR